MPMHFVTDTYEDIDRNCTNPVHRAYCRVKMFRDKVCVYACICTVWLLSTEKCKWPENVIFTVPSQKRAHWQCTLCWAKIRGWADIRGISIVKEHPGNLLTLSS